MQGYHEDEAKLTPEERDVHRAIVSMKEELEAIDWYNQRIATATCPKLKAILEHNRDEERTHAADLAKWLREHGKTDLTEGHVEKSMGWSASTFWRARSVPGGIPGQGGADIARLLDMPKPTRALAHLDHTEPRFSPSSVVDGLGLDPAQANDWKSWISRNIPSASNEVVVRKGLYERFIEQRTPPELRSALFQRALSYYGFMRKSTDIQVVTPDELLEKAEARGGTYYRRVPTAKGGYRYYYEPDKYQEREDSHIDGETALKKRLTKMVLTHVEAAGDKGCDHKTFQTLAKKFGADKVAAALRDATGEGGPLAFEKGIFKKRAAAASAPVQKSQRFIVTR